MIRTVESSRDVCKLMMDFLFYTRLKDFISKDSNICLDDCMKESSNIKDSVRADFLDFCKTENIDAFEIRGWQIVNPMI